MVAPGNSHRSLLDPSVFVEGVELDLAEILLGRVASDHEYASRGGHCDKADSAETHGLDGFPVVSLPVETFCRIGGIIGGGYPS